MADSTEQEFDLQDIPPELRTSEEQALLAARGASGRTLWGALSGSASGAGDGSASTGDPFDALLRTTFAADLADPADEPPARALDTLMARVRADQAQMQVEASVSTPVQEAVQKAAQTPVQTAPQTGAQTSFQSTALPTRPSSLSAAQTAASGHITRTSAAASSALPSASRASQSTRGIPGLVNPAARGAFVRRASLGGAMAALLVLFVVLRPGGTSETSELEPPVRTRGEAGQTGASASVELQAVLEHADGSVRPFPADATLRQEEGLLFRFHVAPHSVGSRLMLLELGSSGQFQVLFQQGVTPAAPPSASPEEAQQQLEITDATGHALRYSPDGGPGDYAYCAIVVASRTPTQPLDNAQLQALQSQLKTLATAEPAPDHLTLAGVSEPVYVDWLRVHYRPEVRP